MKTKFKLHRLLLVTTLFLLGSCVKTYEPPPIIPPNYDGAPSNITIAGFREEYAQKPSPTLIEDDLVMKAVVIGNDISGNIYRQLYISDGSGAINIGIEQNSVFATHRVGQELYLHLKGFSSVIYGGELQIGYSGTNANRIPWQIYKDHVFFDGIHDPNNALPVEVTISQLTVEMVNRLVELSDVSFINGGKNNFTTGNNTTDETIIDGENNRLIVRTSSYSDFANDPLPDGKGTLTGILGRYNGNWQLLIRDRNDVGKFSGNKNEENGNGNDDGKKTFFEETFGKGEYPVAGSRMKIADFHDFDMKYPVTYSDPAEECDVRTISGMNAHVWFPARTAMLVVENINSSAYSDIKLSFEIAANLFSASDAIDLNVMSVSCNGTPYPLESTPVSNSRGDNGKYYAFTLENIPASAALTIEFKAEGTKNTLGLRLDNIKLTGIEKEGGSVIDLFPH